MAKVKKDLGGTRYREKDLFFHSVSLSLSLCGAGRATSGPLVVVMYFRAFAINKIKEVKKAKRKRDKRPRVWWASRERRCWRLSRVEEKRQVTRRRKSEEYKKEKNEAATGAGERGRKNKTEWRKRERLPRAYTSSPGRSHGTTQESASRIDKVEREEPRGTQRKGTPCAPWRRTTWFAESYVLYFSLHRSYFGGLYTLWLILFFSSFILPLPFHSTIQQIADHEGSRGITRHTTWWSYMYTEIC